MLRHQKISLIRTLLVCSALVAAINVIFIVEAATSKDDETEQRRSAGEQEEESGLQQDQDLQMSTELQMSLRTRKRVQRLRRQQYRERQLEKLLATPRSPQDGPQAVTFHNYDTYIYRRSDGR